VKNVLKVVLLASALGATGMAASCGPKADGTAEKAGEKLDNATDDLTKDHRDITDGAAENLGEKMDSAAGDKKAPDSH
jgi:hypothetical protein